MRTLSTLGPIFTLGAIWTVDPTYGRDTGSGTTTATVQGAVNKASPGDVIVILPGSYHENVSIPKNKPGLTLIGAGAIHSGDISPVSGVPLTVDGDSTTLINLDLEAPTTAALVVTGNRCRAYGCKIEGGTIGLDISPRTIANGGNGGADCLFQDCEFAWTATGVQISGTDYGATTELRLVRCVFHNITTAAIAEHVGSGGSAAVTFASLDVSECRFLAAEDGSEPTKYLDMNASNSNTAAFTGNYFEHATNAASTFAIGTGTKWIANKTVAGVSTAAPA